MKLIYDAKNGGIICTTPGLPDDATPAVINVEVPDGKALSTISIVNGKPVPVFIDIRSTEDILKELEELKSKQVTTDLAIVELAAQTLS